MFKIIAKYVIITQKEKVYLIPPCQVAHNYYFVIHPGPVSLN